MADNGDLQMSYLEDYTESSTYFYSCNKSITLSNLPPFHIMNASFFLFFLDLRFGGSHYFCGLEIAHSKVSK